MSIVRRDLGHGFIHVPKTGGSSMRSTEYVGGKNHKTIAEMKPKAPGLFWWGFVRHPCDRIVSIYHSNSVRPEDAEWPYNPYWPRIGTGENLREWVVGLPGYWHEMLHALPMTHFLCINGKLAVDFVGKFEQINEDWAELLTKLKLPHIDLPHRNRSHHDRSYKQPNQWRPWQKHFDQEMLDAAWKVYKNDFEVFGYSP